MIQAPLTLAALIAGTAALSFWLDQRVRLLSRIGAGMIAILLGAAYSNAALVPAASPVYDIVGGPVTSLAIAWLLLAVNIADVRKVGGRVLAGFGLALAGTGLGALVGAVLFAPSFAGETWKLAGTLTGTYTGGSVNFVSVARGTGLPDQLFAGANAADATTTAIWLGATLLLPVWLARFYPAALDDPARASAATEPGGAGRDGSPGEAEHTPAVAAAPAAAVEHPFFAPVAMSTLDLGLLLASGLGLLLLAQGAASLVPAVPAILWLTTFALVTGHTTPLGRVPGALQLGNLALLFFFVIIGIHSRVADIVAVGIDVFWFTVVVVGVHGVIVFGGGRLLRIDVASLAVASQAAVGGPSSALAVAVAREWPRLVLPGVIVGLLGYAIGNYLGFGVAGLVRGLGIGG